MAEAKKAFDLRDRVSERERFYIDDHYYTASGDIEKDKENLELAIRTYPNDSSAYANLALINNLYYGQFETAIQLGNEFSRLEPGAPFGYVHTAQPYIALNRLEEARSISAGIVEETVFRGYLQQQFTSWTGHLTVGILGQSAIFGLAHGYQGWKNMTLIFALGCIFGAFVRLRKGLRANMIAHAGVDILAAF